MNHIDPHQQLIADALDDADEIMKHSIGVASSYQDELNLTSYQIVLLATAHMAAAVSLIQEKKIMSKFIETVSGDYINSDHVSVVEGEEQDFKAILKDGGGYHHISELEFCRHKSVVVPDHSGRKAFQLHAFGDRQVIVRQVALIAWRIFDGWPPVPVLSVEPTSLKNYLYAIELDDEYEIYDNTENPFLIDTYTASLAQARIDCLENYRQWNAELVKKHKAQGTK